LIAGMNAAITSFVSVRCEWNMGHHPVWNTLRFAGASIHGKQHIQNNLCGSISTVEFI
jgi:hypothetical protein